LLGTGSHRKNCCKPRRRLAHLRHRVTYSERRCLPNAQAVKCPSHMGVHVGKLDLNRLAVQLVFI
jgi:hypothetical protein